MLLRPKKIKDRVNFITLLLTTENHVLLINMVIGEFINRQVMKMKILLVETKISGHHLSYAKCLIGASEAQFIFAVPSNIGVSEFPNSVIKLNCGKFESGFIWYKKLIDEVKRVADENNVDVIHFLYGDVFLKYFGYRLSILRKYKVIMTFHQFRYSRLRNYSRKTIFKAITNGVVHTKTLKDYLNKNRIENVVQIEYPHFNLVNIIDKKFAQDNLLIKNDKPILLVLGGTRFDKGLDILLSSLAQVNKPFYLLVAGKEETFKRDFIEAACSTFRENVFLKLNFLSDEEFSLCLNAADYVVLPYRKSFDGASGPLGEGVALKKPILGPSHGSIGEIITKNNIGYTFETENIDDLTETLNTALSEPFVWNNQAEKYRLSLLPHKFIEAYIDLYTSCIS